MVPPTRYRVLVAGGTGFLGGLIATRLAHFGVRQPGDSTVRALVRDRAAAARLRQAGVEVVVGDVTRPAGLASALNGVDAVVNAAMVRRLDDPRQVEAVAVRGAVALFEASRRSGVRRFVQLSSMAVYGGCDGIDRGCGEPRTFGDRYADAKIEAEYALKAAARRTAVPELVILRVGAVYGLGSPHWTEGPVRAARRGTVVVPGFRVPVPYLYTNNLVEAVTAAITTPQPGTYDVFDGTIDYADLITRYARMTGARVVRLAPWVVTLVAALGEVYQRTTGRYSPLTLASLRALRKADRVLPPDARSSASGLGWQSRATLAQGLAVIRAYLDTIP